MDDCLFTGGGELEMGDVKFFLQRVECLRQFVLQVFNIGLPCQDKLLCQAEHDKFLLLRPVPIKPRVLPCNPFINSNGDTIKDSFDKYLPDYFAYDFEYDHLYVRSKGAPNVLIKFASPADLSYICCCVAY